MMNENSSFQSEPELLARLKRGESAAVTSWFRVYQPRMTQFVAQKISVAAEVDEVVQQVFLNCLKHLPLFRGDASIKTWMVRIARHEVADFYRKKYAKKVLQTLPLHQLFAAPVSDSHETSEKVKLALGHLGEPYRELLQLKYIDELSVKIIAEKMGRTSKSVESDLYRARKAFQIAYVALKE